MSKAFKFQCDRCEAVTEATYNGEHHLPPATWGEVINPQNGTTLAHICPECLKEVTKKVKPDGL